jgi:hypothetical protein
LDNNNTLDGSSNKIIVIRDPFYEVFMRLLKKSGCGLLTSMAINSKLNKDLMTAEKNILSDDADIDRSINEIQSDFNPTHE